MTATSTAGQRCLQGAALEWLTFISELLAGKPVELINSRSSPRLREAGLPSVGWISCSHSRIYEFDLRISGSRASISFQAVWL